MRWTAQMWRKCTQEVLSFSKIPPWILYTDMGHSMLPRKLFYRESIAFVDCNNCELYKGFL